MGAVEKIEQMPPAATVAPINAAESLMQMICRVASDPTVDIGRVDQLMERYERLEARQAERDFRDAMSKAQADIKAVLVDKNNSQTKSKYASYAALDEAIRPVYSGLGFSVTYDTEDIDKPDLVRIVAFVWNFGHERKYHVDMPCDGKGAKGGDVMTKTHAMKSAVSYGKSTLLPMIFNIAVTDRADDDGNGAAARSGPVLVSDDQVTELRELLFSTGANFEQFLKAAKVDALEDILAKNYEPLCAAVKRRAADRRPT